MLKAFARALHPWRELRRFKQLSREERTCVFAPPVRSSTRGWSKRSARRSTYPPTFSNSLIGESPLEAFTDRLERLRVSGLKDPALTEALSGHSGRGPTAVLFTGGGILRENLLELPGVRFLHIHPGFLPHVRGADGLLWSSLVRGRPGALVGAEEFPRITFPRSLTDSLDDAMLYRALFSFYDPILRAKMLTNVLRAGADLLNLPAEPQDTRVGVTYHFMSPASPSSLPNIVPASKSQQLRWLTRRNKFLLVRGV